MDVAIVSSNGAGNFEMEVGFEGGSAPFALQGTRNCSSCCDGAHSVDFDVSADGLLWVNGTNAALRTKAKRATVTFDVSMPTSVAPKYVRHTAASIWPQCALYNKEGLPALPFHLEVPK